MNPASQKRDVALTLIELTLVVAVLLGLISVLFLGATSYKEGSNRSMCILNISQAQKAVRAYQNMYQKNFGDECTMETLVGEGRMLEYELLCPSGGEYTWLGAVPALDSAYLSCSMAASRHHIPTNTGGW